MKFQLRPYQEQGVADIRAQFAAGKKSVLYVLPTGGGKTVTYSHIAEQAGLRGNRVLILEHRKELIRQASLALGGLGVRHGIVAPADKIADIRRAHVETHGQPFVHHGANVAVASVQTLGRRMNWLREFDPALIIIDEAHHAVAGTWARILDASPRSRFLGVTATPVRTDGQGLGDVFQAMVLGPSMADLIDAGALVPPKIYGFPVKADLSKVHMRGGDYNAKELAEALDTPTILGDAVEHYRKLAHRRPAIVFCASIRHAEHTAQAFRAAGYSFHVIKGDMDDRDRDRLIYGLAEGRIHGLVSVDVISEGTDIPVAEVAIMLRATESESLYLQQAGRVLRPAPDKDYGLILDHVGNVLRHGRPHEDREWTLQGRKRTRREREPRDNVRFLQCPDCYFVHEPEPTCPSCGHHYEARALQPRQVEGELQEYKETPEEIARRQARRQQGRAQTVADLVKLGYSEGRARHILAARQEKQRLQDELLRLLERWRKTHGGQPGAALGFSASDVRGMKPKQLRDAIARVGEALFMGHANDNEPEKRQMQVGG